jgi:hypothetical protein
VRIFVQPSSTRGLCRLNQMFVDALRRLASSELGVDRLGSAVRAMSIIEGAVSISEQWP